MVTASSEDLKSQCEELERGVVELRSLLKEASEQYGALERGKAQQAKDFDEELQKREGLIADLRDELEKVNLLLEANAKKGNSDIIDIMSCFSKVDFTCKCNRFFLW